MTHRSGVATLCYLSSPSGGEGSLSVQSYVETMVLPSSHATS